MCWVVRDDKWDQIIFRTKRLTATGSYGRCEDLLMFLERKFSVTAMCDSCPKTFCSPFFTSIKMNKKCLQFFPVINFELSAFYRSATEQYLSLLMLRGSTKWRGTGMSVSNKNSYCSYPPTIQP
jgi:hypothetical protein